MVSFGVNVIMSSMYNVGHKVEVARYDAIMDTDIRDSHTFIS